MARKESYTKYENKLVPAFREKMDQAESTEDVKKFFVYTAKELFEDVFGGKIQLAYEDIELTPESHPPYRVSEGFSRSEAFLSTCKDSDLPDILSRLAETAVNRYRHLEKNPEKTELKIRMRHK